MVVKNGYSLELVDAVTKEPLREFTGPSGKVFYCEAGPGGEYFLRLQVLADTSAAGKDSEKDATGAGGEKAATKVVETSPDATEEHKTMVYFRPSVDGEDLGFYTNLSSSQGARDVGLWTYVNGIGTNKALKFNVVGTSPANGSVTASSTAPGANTTFTVPNPLAPKDSGAPVDTQPSLLLTMGQVHVNISEAVFTGYQKRVYAVPTIATSEGSEPFVPKAISISASSSLHDEDEVDSSTAGKSTTPEPVPVLRSSGGDVCFHQEYTEECPTYKPGKLLETITILYGSKEALVDAGVICPVPPTLQVDCSGAPTAIASDAGDLKRALPGSFETTDGGPQGKKACRVVDEDSSNATNSPQENAATGGILVDFK